MAVVHDGRYTERQRDKHRNMATVADRIAQTYVDESEYERINGQVVARVKVAGLPHSDIQGNVYRLLWERGRTTGLFKVGVEWSVAGPDTPGAEPDYLTPDILLALHPFKIARNGHLIPPGFLAVEVVSPGQDDLFDKAQLYAAWGIKHVWIINPQSKVCLEYHGGDQFTRVKTELRADAISIRLDEIFNVSES